MTSPVDISTKLETWENAGSNKRLRWCWDGYIDGYPMAKNYSIAEARDQLPALVHEAERGKHIRLTRRGKAVALLISVADYERLSSQRADIWDKLQDFRTHHDLTNIDVDEVFENVRDRSPGKDFDW